MQNLPFLLYVFFRKRRLVFLLALLGICALLGIMAAHIRLEEDITRFVPVNEETRSVNAILDNLKSKDKLVIHFSAPDARQIDQLLASSAALHDSLTKVLGPDDYTDITYKISDDLMLKVYGLFYHNLPFFLEEKDYAQIGSRLHKDSIAATLEKDYQSLLTPSGMVLGQFIRKDPLNFVPIALKKLQNIRLDDSFETYEGAIVTRDRHHLLLFITPAHGPNDTKGNAHLIQEVKRICQQVGQQYNSLRIEPFGASMVSAGNSEQIRKDSLITTSIAIVLIALLLGIYFRNPLVVVFILLPVGFGMVFSLSMLYLMKGVVSAISVGAGAIVLGIAINYSLHFFTHYKHERDIKTVLKDLTLPMLIGCTTTVGAFFSLSFTQSAALQDFGQFAGYSLIGALLFSILVLPQLLRFSFRREKTKNPSDTPHHENFLERLTAYRLDKNKTVILTAIALTLVFGWFSSDVAFESDMNKMSYMDSELRDAEQHLDSVNHFAARSVYIFCSGASFNEALENNQAVTRTLQEFKDKGLLLKYSSVNQLLPSHSEQALRLRSWNRFFSPSRRDSTLRYLALAAGHLGFKANAFEEFDHLLQRPFSDLVSADADSLRHLLFKEWITTVNGRPTLVNHIKVDAAHKAQLYAAFADNKNCVVFDKQLLTSRFVEIISHDFNTILLSTSLLVFGFMLLSHGRIELAIINFLPMLLSWIWILGLMALLDIKFNVINIIISTFIFGLGDDYSIFIMDGLLNDYKYGRKNLNSYKTSILLSALITIIGIGVLILAKHPALRSIASITIIGMFCVVFISFIVQPLLFNWLAISRHKRGLQPYTFGNLLITVVGFMGFMLGTLLLTLIGVIVFALFPLNIRKKKAIFHYCIMQTLHAILYSFVNVRKTVLNPQQENFKKPAIIVANHQSFIDLAMILQLYPKMIVFTNDKAYRSPFYGWIVRMADYFPTSAGYENSVDKVKEMVDHGYSVLIFPEGTRSVDGEIHRFHKGAFLLAERLQMDIIPILIHGAGDAVTKGDFHFKKGELTVKILPRITASDTSFGNSYQERTKSICRYMREEYAALRERVETVDYFRARLIRNYILKGPVLEWYCRIKTKMEGNYWLFESVLPKKGLIVDVGCGYGFLPYMLHYMSKDRQILGVDYDEDKVGVANHIVHKTSNMRFETGDVTVYDFPQADAFVISDVLHYLREQEQVELIERCIARLNKGGVLLLRDADTDLEKRQKGTWYTEFISTNTGFNRTKEGGLHFVSGRLIKDTLQKHPHLEIEVIDNTKHTSNIIYVCRYV